MKNNTVIDTTIRDLYKNLYTISVALLDNFTDENVLSTLKKRAVLLKQIDDYKTTSGDAAPLDRGTKDVMAKLIEVDKIITNRIQHRMDEISGEMKGLHRKSRAAAAYTAYKK